MNKDSNTNNSLTSSTSPSSLQLTTNYYTETSSNLLISMDTNTDENRSQQSIINIQSRRLSEEWLPPHSPIATSTPIVAVSNPSRSAAAAAAAPHHTLQDEENELFNNIEQLIRDYVERPNRHFPLTRIIQWTTTSTDQQSRIEHVVVVVINRPTIIL